MSIEFKKTGKPFNTLVKRMSLITAKRLGTVAKDELIKDTVEHGWRRFKRNIRQASIDKNTEMIFVDDKENSKAIMGYLSGGTKAHFVAPVKARALSWVQGGNRFFSKGHRVSGIKASNTWGLTNRVRMAMNDFTSDELKKIFS